MNWIRPASVALVAAVGAVTLLGCKAKPAKDSGFLENADKMTKDPNVPFNRGYWNREVDFKKYRTIYVAPVNTNYVMAQNLWERAGEASISREQINQGIKDMAEYTRQSFIRAAAEDKKHRFTVVDKAAGDDTLVLEVAIVQLVPSKAVLNAIGFVTWIPAVVTLAGSTASQSEDMAKGVVAIEARLRDGKTGNVVGMFADRERPPATLIDVKSLNWWAPCKTVVDTWSKQFIELSNNPGKKVADSSTVELLQW